MTATVSAPSSTQPSDESKPMIYLAADLGKSDCKFLYWTNSTNIRPLWLSSSLVQDVDETVLRFFEVGGELSESAYLQVNGVNILVGNSASSYQGSFLADKGQTAAYQILTALGIAAIELELLDYEAQLSIALPLNEFQSRSEIAQELEHLSHAFRVCGRPQTANIKATFYPEGMGLYLLHKQSREKETATAYSRRLVVMMMGHRNLSLLVFESGKLNSMYCQVSDTLGFWESFKVDAPKLHVREVDYQSLQSALFSGKPEQFSFASSRRKDFSAEVAAIRSGYMQRLEPFCNEAVGQLLASSTPSDVMIGGGVGHLMRTELRDCLVQIAPDCPVYFADSVSSTLLLLAGQSRGGESDMARPMRMADVYGLALMLAGRQQRKAA
jgi:Actin like proteins N terminal domain